MTLDEFEFMYAAHSGLDLLELYALGLHGAPCDCGEPDCQGWQMLGPNTPPDPNVAVSSDIPGQEGV